MRGDLQMHSKWSDGMNTIEEMANEALKTGKEYILITDHFRPIFSNKLNSQTVVKQWQEIDKLNSKFKIQNSKFIY